MNKHVVRTSLVWLCILVLAGGLLLYRSRLANSKSSGDEGSQPVAVGPPPNVNTGSAQPEKSTETPLAPVQLTPQRRQSIGVQTGTVEWKQIADDIRATGTVNIDERLVSYVQVRFSGYIRKVFADATYQYVRKGEPLFTIYSPDLVATQQDLLLAQENQRLLGTSTVDGVASGAAALSTAAEERLRQWDVPEREIKKLERTGKPTTDLVVDSPVSGYITERNALPNLYVEPATRLYSVADLSRVWVYAQIFQNDIGRLKPSDAAQITVDAYPGRTFRGRIESILPQVDLATRTVRVRLDVSNSGLKLKPGMFVNVDLKTSLGRRLIVPASAVLSSGTRQLVFVDRGDGNLEPKEVVTGPRVGDDYIILKGLAANQHIATSASFLIDSESQLQAAAGSFTPPPPGSGGLPAANQQPTSTQANVDFITDPNPPRKGSNTFQVKLTGVGGKAISGADVTVTFYMAAMPAMGMAAMNTTLKLNEKGSDIYAGTGSLGSGGTWQVSITAQKNGQTIAIKHMSLNATGGM